MWSPRYNRVIVEFDEESPSPVLHIDTRSMYVRAVVKAKGPLVGCDLTQLGWVARPSIEAGAEKLLNVGDKVLINRGDVITHIGQNNEKIMFINESQILAHESNEA